MRGRQSEMRHATRDTPNEAEQTTAVPNTKPHTKPQSNHTGCERDREGTRRNGGVHRRVITHMEPRITPVTPTDLLFRTANSR